MTASAVPLPHPTLPSLHGLEEPGWHEMDNLKRDLRENAIAMKSTGNGILGHLPLVVAPATYLLESNNVPFVVPVNPGANAIVPDNATNFQMTQINHTFLVQTKHWDEYLNAQLELKKLLLAAVPDKYIRSLKSKLSGYTNVSILAILDHLDAKFSKISDAALRDNHADLERTWSTADSIDTVWDHIEQCRDFATAGENPISDKTVIAAALMVIENTGQFSHDIHDWNKKPAADKTYDNLVLHFTEADYERRRKLTARNAGYQGTALLAATDSATAPPAAQALLAPAAAPPADSSQMYYCFSHGLTSDRRHTSATCTKPSANHDTTATAHNMKGGNNYIRRRRDEKAVWKPTPRPAAPAETN
jgi:hypothetical protein